MQLLSDVLIVPVMLTRRRPALPKDLVLPDDKPALSDCDRDGYFFVAPISKFVPEEHRLIAEAAFLELSDFNVKHGTKNTYQRGCRGPLCLRAHRVYQHRYLARKQGREDSRQELKPHYFAVEPLLEALTIYAKELNGLPT